MSHGWWVGWAEVEMSCRGGGESGERGEEEKEERGRRNGENFSMWTRRAEVEERWCNCTYHLKKSTTPRSHTATVHKSFRPPATRP